MPVDDRRLDAIESTVRGLVLSLASKVSTAALSLIDGRVTALEAIQSLTPRTVAAGALVAAAYDSIVYTGVSSATLPAAASNVGKMIMFEENASATDNMTLTVSGGGDIAGAATRIWATADAQFTVWSDGTEWRVRGTAFTS